MYKVRKRFTFEAAHALTSSYSKECQDIHGHSYIVDVIVGSKTLNEDGMVIDFKKLNEIVKPLLQDWDHALLLNIPQEQIADLVGLSKSKTVSFRENPTAENMAKHLFNVITYKLRGRYGVASITVRVHETATGWASYEEE